MQHIAVLMSVHEQRKVFKNRDFAAADLLGLLLFLCMHALPSLRIPCVRRRPPTLSWGIVRRVPVPMLRMTPV